MATVLEIIKRTTEFFSGKGVENPRLNAELLIGHALGLKRMELYLQFERALAEVELEKIRPLVRRRGQREPLQYILGETEFSGLRLKVDRRALIPRPETELLVERIVAHCAQLSPPASILDLGTGSGAVALALAKTFPLAVVTAVDASEEALALARDNSATTGLSERVTILESDWFSRLPVGSVFDLIVSNPPYLSRTELDEASPEVRVFEPASALVPTRGEGGAADLVTLIATAPQFLAPGGMLALETGVSQHAQLLALAARNGLSRTASEPDLTGRDRFIFAWKASA